MITGAMIHIQVKLVEYLIIRLEIPDIAIIKSADKMYNDSNMW